MSVWYRMHKVVRQIKHSLPTAKDVANRAGVSQSTVSRVLSRTGYVDVKTALKVRQAAQELGYIVNGAARSVRTQRTGDIGIVVPSISNPFYAETIEVFIQVARKAGKRVLIQVTDDDPARHEDVIDDLLSKRVEGLIIASAPMVDKYLANLIKKNCPVPCIFYNRKLDNDDGNWIVPNNRTGSLSAVKYLVRGGHKHIIYISGPILYSTTKERLDGYLNAVAQFNLEPLVYESDLGYDGSYGLVSRAFQADRKCATAIITSNDLMAIGAMDALWDMNLSVGQDVAVIGFDDIKMGSFRGIRLTTVAQNKNEMASKAISSLLNLVNGKETVVREVVPQELIVRSTA